MRSNNEWEDTSLMMIGEDAGSTIMISSRLGFWAPRRQPPCVSSQIQDRLFWETLCRQSRHWLSTVSMTFDFSDPGQCYAHKLPQESMTNTKSFTFKNRTYMAIVSVLAVPLVFHSWSPILLNVEWRCVWLLLLMTKEKQLFHAMQCIYRNCHST